MQVMSVPIGDTAVLTSPVTLIRATVTQVRVTIPVMFLWRPAFITATRGTLATLGTLTTPKMV
jgi:hypothetical protein